LQTSETGTVVHQTWWLNFPIVSFPFQQQLHTVYISQLIHIVQPEHWIWIFWIEDCCWQAKFVSSNWCLRWFWRFGTFLFLLFIFCKLVKPGLFTWVHLRFKWGSSYPIVSFMCRFFRPLLVFLLCLTGWGIA
jgi:hypothetical protein